MQCVCTTCRQTVIHVCCGQPRGCNITCVVPEFGRCSEMQSSDRPQNLALGCSLAAWCRHSWLPLPASINRPVTSARAFRSPTLRPWRCERGDCTYSRLRKTISAPQAPVLAQADARCTLSIASHPQSCARQARPGLPAGPQPVVSHVQLRTGSMVSPPRSRASPQHLLRERQNK